VPPPTAGRNPTVPDALLTALSAATDSSDDVGTTILDAALDEIQTHGLRRTTVEDVARAAGVARITIYRRFPTKDDLVRAVLVREGQRLFASVDAAVGGRSVEDGVVEGFVAILGGVRRHALTKRLLETEPETILPFFTTGAGPVIAASRLYLAGHLKAAQKRGQLKAFDADAIAELLVRVAISMVLTPESTIPLETDRQLRAFARRYVLPTLGARGG
jgi:AcrR family transcriptional regulator